MKNEIQLFHNDEFGEVRTVMIDGNPWFVGKDVACILGYAKPQNAIANHVDDEDKTSALIQGTGSNYKSKTVLINESGVYSLILSSQLPNAKSFKRWVTSEILPALRKTGGYSVNDSAYFIGKFFPYATEQQQTLLQVTLDHLDALSRQIETDKPKVEFADHVAESESLIDMNTMSKLAKHNGIKIGQNRLFEWLRDNGILMKNNVPYQIYMERGYFKVREGSFTVNGETRLYHKTLVTGKGQLFIIRKLLEEYADDADD
ncbi:MAG: phage antirepressor KilAC domain-containing protein [Ruminococcus sp.]|nr:phage antirepressor KilAC domain-containing protein [Ruminococcus sp.]